MRYLFLLIVLLSSCKNTKQTHTTNAPLKIVDAYYSTSTLGYQNMEGSSSSTTYTIKIDKAEGVEIKNLYVYGVPYEYQALVNEDGEELLVVQIWATDVDENIEEAEGVISTPYGGIIDYTIHAKNKRVEFNFTKKSTIQNK